MANDAFLQDFHDLLAKYHKNFAFVILDDGDDLECASFAGDDKESQAGVRAVCNWFLREQDHVKALVQAAMHQTSDVQASDATNPP